MATSGKLGQSGEGAQLDENFAPFFAVGYLRNGRIVVDNELETRPK